MRPLVLVALLLTACAGPEAPDGALCRDVAHRLCLEPRCAAVDQQLHPGADCEASLTAAAGCATDDFAFTTPSRADFLACRVALLRNGTSDAVAPGCDDVDQLLTGCPQVARLYGGTP